MRHSDSDHYFSKEAYDTGLKCKLLATYSSKILTAVLYIIRIHAGVCQIEAERSVISTTLTLIQRALGSVMFQIQVYRIREIYLGGEYIFKTQIRNDYFFNLSRINMVSN